MAMNEEGNYKVRLPFGGQEKILERDVDFGVIPGTKSPSLLKAGAEKICMAYGLRPIVEEDFRITEWRKGEKGEDLFFGLF